MSGVARAWSRWRRAGVPTLSLLALSVLVLSAVFAPIVSPHDPNRLSLRARLSPPAILGGVDGHILGTDSLGRDLLSQLIHGSRISLYVGFIAVSLGATVGVALGLIAGYYEGHVDNVIMRLGDIQLAFPFILLAITFMAVLGPGLINVIIVLALRSWVPYARVVRGDVLRIKGLDFISASVAIGGRDLRVMLRHIAPNLMAPVIVLASFAVAQTIILEASLSFLGFGGGSRISSWGAVLANGRDYLTNAWWISAFSGLFITVAVLAINTLGDWLRDYLDPRLRGF